MHSTYKPGLWFMQHVTKKVNLPLLILLLVFTIDKVVLKFAGIGLVFLFNSDFSFKSKIKQLPLFYLFIICMELVKFLLLNKDFTYAHFVTLTVGCLFWLLAFLALYQMRSVLNKESLPVIENTIGVFFITNAIFSLGQLGVAMIQSGSFNPFALGDIKFGTSTGDRIKGLLMGPSYLNMMINSFFVFYFTFKKRFLLAFLALVVAALTTSNFANLILIIVLLVCLLFKRDRFSKFACAGYLLFLVAFYVFASPRNLQYLKSSIWVNKKQQKELIAYQLEAGKQPEAKTNGHINVEYASERVDQLLNDPSFEDHKDSSLLINLKDRYGKLIAFKQSFTYLASGVRPLLFGAGIGSYSSFLALRMSKINGQEGSRLFQQLPTYIAPEFKKDHYQVFKTIYSLPIVFHSAKHFPNSFVNQLFGEYGLLGGALFFFTYVIFFVRHFKNLTYGRYLILLLGGFLLMDYLFEYLSVVVIFELLMLKDMMEAKIDLRE